MRTKVVSFFIFLQDLSKQGKKSKKLRPKMIKNCLKGDGPALKRSQSLQLKKSHNLLLNVF